MSKISPGNLFLVGMGALTLSGMAFSINKAKKSDVTINAKVNQSKDKALKYMTPQQLYSAEEKSFEDSKDKIMFYDSIAADGAAKKAYQEGAQMVRDSIAKAAKTVK